MFDNPTEAEKLRLALKDLEHLGQLSLENSAIVIKDENGQIQVKNQYLKSKILRSP